MNTALVVARGTAEYINWAKDRFGLHLRATQVYEFGGKITVDFEVQDKDGNWVPESAVCMLETPVPGLGTPEETSQERHWDQIALRWLPQDTLTGHQARN